MDMNEEKENNILSDERYIQIIMDALVDTTGDIEPKAQYIFMNKGKVHSISWKNIGNNLNLFNALSVIWGIYSMVELSEPCIKAGGTFLLLMKDMLELTDMEIKTQDAIVLYCAKKCGASNIWVDEASVVCQVECEKKDFAGSEELRDILLSMTKSDIAKSITNLTNLKVVEQIDGKVKICESISPNALNGLTIMQ